MLFQTFDFARENAGGKELDNLRARYARIRDMAHEAGIEDFDVRVRAMAKGPTKPSPEDYVKIATRVYDEAMRSGEGRTSRRSHGGHPRAIPTDKMLREQAFERKYNLD